MTGGLAIRQPPSTHRKDIMSKTRFEFSCDGYGHEHEWGSPHSIDLSVRDVRDQLVAEVGVITGMLEPSGEAKADGVATLEAIWVRFINAEGDEQSFMIESSTALVFAGEMVEWLKRVMENDEETS